MPRLTHLEAEMVIVLIAQLMISGKVLGKSKNHVGKTIKPKMVIILDQQTFWKKNCDFIKLTEKKFQVKHPNIIEIRYCFLGRVRTA